MNHIFINKILVFLELDSFTMYYNYACTIVLYTFHNKNIVNNKMYTVIVNTEIDYNYLLVYVCFCSKKIFRDIEESY